MRGWLSGILLTAVAFTALAVPARPVDAEDAKTVAARTELDRMREAMLQEAGTQMAKVGVWCRDAGLVAQATTSFLRAVEVSEGRNAWAVRILALMQSLDEAFWPKRLKKPSPGMVRGYTKRMQAAEEDLAKARWKLAKWADKKGLVHEAYKTYREHVLSLDIPLEAGDDGLIATPQGKIPKEHSEKLLERAIRINGRLAVRDATLELLGDIQTIFLAANNEAVVRSESSMEQASGLLALVTALVPFLEADMGGRPTRPLRVLVFAKRSTFESWCDQAGLGGHKQATGVADSKTWATVICGEGLSEETLQGIVLHECTHLFQYGVSPAVMPSWYNEGVAETYGAPGTFTWDGKKLEVGGPQDAERVRAQAADGAWIPFERFLTDDAMTLITRDDGSSHAFYLQSWAFVRWLRTAAGKDIAERFEQFELLARGSGAGAQAGQHRSHDAKAASELFTRTVGPDVRTLETDFRAWLAAFGS
ncbi:MAG: hypothetical protein AB7T63_03430 [Planctomycetota bacterium]